MNCYNSECSICFTTPQLNDIIIKTPCKHFICMKCLSDGGFRIRKCPLCRNKLTEAYGFQNNEQIFILNEENCPHCVVQQYLKNS